jgi:phosphatidylethanolamine-binding protein (PEBP) family uncharacterized protein
MYGPLPRAGDDVGSLTTEGLRMKSTNRSLAMALALSFGVLGVACSPEGSDNNGTGGSSGAGGKGGSGGSTGGRGGSTGGSNSTGGTTGGSSSAGGSGGSTGGSGGSTGGSGGSTGGSGGSTGGSGGSTGGSGGSTGGSGGTGGSTGGTGGSISDAGKTDGMGGSEAGGGGAFALTVTGFTPGPMGRNCYPPGSNDMGNKSPKLDWGPAPAGTMSWVLTTEDKSDMGPHQVVCHIPASVLGQPMDVKGMIPAGAEKGTRHGKADHIWYGPGASNVRQYEIRIWAIPTAKLPVSCAGSAGAVAAFRYLKMNMANKELVLATDGKSFWGNRTGACQ